MPSQVPALTARLKSLGFTLGNRRRLYGEMFEMAGDPIIVNDTLVLVDASRRNRENASESAYSASSENRC